MDKTVLIEGEFGPDDLNLIKRYRDEVVNVYNFYKSTI
jgi:hypothetical protein